MLVFFFSQKTAYEIRISDWSTDVCSSDLSSYLSPHRCPARARLFRGRQDRASPKVWRFPRRQRPPRRPCGIPSVAPPPSQLPSVGPCEDRHSEVSERERRRGDGWRGVVGREIGRASCRERGCRYV